MRKEYLPEKGIDLLQLQEWFRGSSDILQKTKTFKSEKGTYSLEIFYCPNLVDAKMMNEVILPRIKETVQNEGRLKINQLTTLMEISILEDYKNIKKQVEQKLFSGELVIFDNVSNDLYFIPISNLPKRSPEESNIETSVRGPRDGFVENISDNIALIRQRLKTSTFKSIEYTIGERSGTKVLLLYIDDIINPEILDKVQQRLESLKFDVLNSSNQLEEMLYDHPYSIFPLMDYIGRPDYVVSSLNQGRFAILVDGNPSCLIGPTNLNQLFFSPEDDHASFYYISFVRILRIMALLTTAFLPGFYIALITYQVDQVPYTLLATISVSRLGLPLSAPLEAFIMLTLFELFKEAGVRLPKAVGQTVAVLGGLIIGDAAIRAGLTSPSMLVVISITVISGYTLINQNLSGNIALLRYFVLFFSASLGLYGFFISFFIICTYIASIESFGQPYVAVLSMPKSREIIKTYLKLPFKLLKERNLANQPQDKDRQKE